MSRLKRHHHANQTERLVSQTTVMGVKAHFFEPLHLRLSEFAEFESCSSNSATRF